MLTAVARLAVGIGSTEWVQLTVLCLLTVISGIYVKGVLGSRHIPRVGKQYWGWYGKSRAKRDFLLNGASMVAGGYHKYKDSMFKVQTADMERIVLSPKYIDELRAAPESILSVRKGMCERHLGRYTTLDVITTSHLQNDVCRVQLTQNLHQLIGPMQAEASYWTSRKIQSVAQSEATPLNGYQTILDIVTGITSRVMIGLPAARDEVWLTSAKGYALDVMAVSTDLRPYPAVLRPFIYPWLQSVKRLKRHIKVTNQVLRPVFEARAATVDKTPGEKPLDMAQWVVESARGRDRNPSILTLKMLFLTLASVHTSAMTVTHALFDICAMPEYIQPLREEIRDVLSQYGWTREGLYNLKKLDSFLRESQRINHPGLLSFNRKVVQELHLKDGAVVPANSFITMATSSIARDPAIYPKPDDFDGFRFYNKRNSSPTEANRHQFVSTGPDNLAFGHGVFACPGRFFAVALAKIVMAELILNFDVTFPGDQVERPRNTFYGESIGPDRSQKVVFAPCAK